MVTEIIYLDKSSGVPLYGVDFIGIIDRGTNIIELKPLTICNLKCRYCFVSAGDYQTNFIVDLGYLIEKVDELVNIKGRYGIEIHLAPYGEILLYPQLFELIERLWNIEGVETISMQTNGLLLNQDVITQLESTNLTRINISLNTLSQKKATYLSNCPDFNIKDLQKNIELLLLSKINVLLAPVWFPGENDEDIEDLIKYTLDLKKRGYSEEKIQIGIQKYLIYKTGRKLKKIRPKSWDYFYKQLTKLEKKHKIKLKLGPNDFNIHKRRKYPIQRFNKNEIHRLTVVSKGRWDNEYIGKINDNSGIKILVDKSLVHSENLVGSEIEVKIIKANYKNNLLTAVFPK
jgi:uncharacterized Fe-S cluster-containing radical SAM superfamily enzyme